MHKGKTIVFSLFMSHWFAVVVFLLAVVYQCTRTELNCASNIFVSFQVICLSPTYELALQTGQVAEKMGKFCPEVKIGYAVRGEKGN